MRTLTCRVNHRNAQTRAKCPKCQSIDVRNVVKMASSPPASSPRAEVWPSEVKYRTDGTVRQRQFKRDGELYLVVDYYEDGSSVKSESYHYGRRAHRDDGPSLIVYRKDGSVEVMDHHRHGYRHREDGPAAIAFREDGSVLDEGYFLHNERVSEEEVLQSCIEELLSLPRVSPENAAAREWLEPHIRRDPSTRAFLPPSDDLVEIALKVCPDPSGDD